jgi:hypothetical protein
LNMQLCDPGDDLNSIQHHMVKKNFFNEFLNVHFVSPI